MYVDRRVGICLLEQSGEGLTPYYQRRGFWLVAFIGMKLHQDSDQIPLVYLRLDPGSDHLHKSRYDVSSCISDIKMKISRLVRHDLVLDN